MPTQLPQVNAQLLTIAVDSGSENYTHKGTTAVKWEGEMDAYVIRKIKSALNESGELNRVQEVNIIVPTDFQPPVDIVAGDTLTFEQWDGNLGEMRVYTGRAQASSMPSDLPGLPNEMKIALEKVLARP